MRRPSARPGAELRTERRESPTPPRESTPATPPVSQVNFVEPYTRRPTKRERDRLGLACVWFPSRDVVATNDRKKYPTASPTGSILFRAASLTERAHTGLHPLLPRSKFVPKASSIGASMPPNLAATARGLHEKESPTQPNSVDGHQTIDPLHCQCNENEWRLVLGQRRKSASQQG